MEIIQINGQRICGPPKNWLGPPPPHGTEIFIKNIPEEIMEQELYKVFSTVGEVYQVRVPIFWNGLNRGYAFVRFTRTEYVKSAIKQLRTIQMQIDRNIKIEMSVDNNRLFLSAVSNDKSEKDILEELKNVVENVKRVYVYPSFTNPTLYRGYAFVEFESHRDAAIAKRILTPELCGSIFERNCIAAWANPPPLLHDEILEKVSDLQICILFVRNIPQGISEITLKDTIQIITGFTLERVKKLNGIAFLTFKSHLQAKMALEILKANPNILGRGNLGVEWAVPRELARAKNLPPDFNVIKSPKLNSEPTGKTKNLTDMALRKRLQNLDLSYIQSVPDNFSENQCATEWQVENSVNDLVGNLQHQNFRPCDFINHNLISFEKCSENLKEKHNDSGFFDEVLIQGADDIRLNHLNFWLKNLNFGSDSSRESCAPPTNSSCYERFQDKKKKCRMLKQRKANNVSE